MSLVRRTAQRYRQGCAACEQDADGRVQFCVEFSQQTQQFGTGQTSGSHCRSVPLSRKRLSKNTLWYPLSGGA